MAGDEVNLSRTRISCGLSLKSTLHFHSVPGSSAALQDMLANRHLRDLLVEVDRSRDPQQALQKAMNIPVFVEFADECLKQCRGREAS